MAIFKKKSIIKDQTRIIPLTGINGQYNTLDFRKDPIVTFQSGDLSTYSKLYKELSSVSSKVDLVSNKFIGLNGKLYNSKKKRLGGTPESKLLAKHPMLGHWLIKDCLIYGVGLVEKLDANGKTTTGFPFKLRPIMSPDIILSTDQYEKEIVKVKNTRSGEEWSPEELIIFKEYNAGHPTGLSRLEKVLKVAETEGELIKYIISNANDHGRAEVIYFLNNDLGGMSPITDKDKFDNFKTTLKNGDRNKVVNADVKDVKTINGISGKEMQVLDNRLRNKAEIRDIFGVPSVYDEIGTASGDTIKQAKKLLYDNAIKPLGDLLEICLNSQLFDTDTINFELDYSEFLKVDDEDRINIMKQGHSFGLFTLDELRIAENLEPYAIAGVTDVPYIEANNMRPYGQVTQADIDSNQSEISEQE